MWRMRKILTLMKMILKVFLSLSIFMHIRAVSLKQILILYIMIIIADDEEEDMLEHYLAEKSDLSTHSSMRAS